MAIERFMMCDNSLLKNILKMDLSINIMSNLVIKNALSCSYDELRESIRKGLIFRDYWHSNSICKLLSFKEGILGCLGLNACVWLLGK